MVYENRWESLDRRPVPQWFEDAKFGIFIHWGLYSVPAYSERGTFAEWYGHWLGQEESAARKFHHRVYGPDFRYADFAPLFRAELFDANAWVDLFARAGARYVNLTSKHHDGFCLFPSSYAPFWNSVDAGPHRDLCAELRDACRGTSVRFGVYHSLYEWWHPLYLKDPEAYAREHLLPMMQELVEKYEPATLFTDGEWDHPSATWHSEDFLQWLYNESPVKDIIVPNDRWGKETRGVHGGNFTTEYGIGGEGFDARRAQRPFEECRGIGGSFGFNRAETAEDYLPTRELLRLLISLVSRGGNLLLNVGPAADGTIPAIMEERLLEMGQWLRVNGEAIYESRKHTVTEDGTFFYTARAGKIYAITQRYPTGELIFSGVDYRPGMTVRLLGYGGGQALSLHQRDGKAAVTLPPITPDQLAGEHFYTFELA